MRGGITVTTRRWLTVVAAAAALVVGGVYCWQLPWSVQAVVIGQFWTPHFALAMLALGLAGLASGAIAGVARAYRRWQNRSWAFEIASLTITGLGVAWLVSIAVTALFLLPADAHFTEMRVGGQQLVVRTTTFPNVSRTTGERKGLLVRWDSSERPAR